MTVNYITYTRHELTKTANKFKAGFTNLYNLFPSVWKMPMKSYEFEAHKELYGSVLLSLAVMEWNRTYPAS
jgi:hypothetical protein